MNGLRTVRKYISKLNDEDLQALWELAKDDIEYESVVVTYLMECEIEERKEKLLKEVTKGVRELGTVGYVTTKMMGLDRHAVYVDAEYFGIWDTKKKTFVD